MKILKFNENISNIDVSEEKIKDVFEKIELVRKQKDIDNDKKFKDNKRLATFNALRKREHGIISKDANKYNI